MKLTITTLVIVEGSYIQGIFHSLEEHPGISMYGHYIACKSLDISSEEEYMNQLTDIELICNEL